MIGGWLYLLGSDLLVSFKIDDAVDAIPVHMFGGLWGLLAVGFLSKPDLMLQAYGTAAHPGFFYSISEGHNDARLLACQVCGALFIFGWTLVTMLPFFLWLNFMGWFRSESVHELVGLDLTYGLDTAGGAEGKLLDDDVQEEYLDAYERYRQNMANSRANAAE